MSERKTARRIYVDVTTLLESRGPAHGITRLLHKTLIELHESVPHLSLCAYDQGQRRFCLLQATLDSLMAETANTAIPTVSVATKPLQAIEERARNFRSRLYFALPVERRLAALRIVTLGRMAGDESLRFLRGGGRTPLAARRLQGSIDFQPGDTFLQWGALWNCHGIADALRELRAKRVRVVSLVYDLIPIVRPEFFDQTMAARFLAWALATLETSEHVIAISKSTQQDLEQVALEYSRPRPSISILRLGDDSLAVAPASVCDSVAALASRPFVLCLGTLEIRKNHRLLYQVWRRLAAGSPVPRLVIVGQRGWLTEETTSLFLRDRLLSDHVRILHGADDQAAAWLLSRALFTVYPSFYEGWGLPVAESLHAGRIVVASDASAVIEAGQGLAYHLPCDDVPAWTQTIDRLCRDAAERSRSEARIAAHMVRHTWAQSASELAQTIVDFAAQEPTASNTGSMAAGVL